MSGPSASQETQLDYLIWELPDSPPLTIRRAVMEGIHREVSETFAAAPHRCAETGGVLLGRHEDGRSIVEDFEPVPSEHRFGPSYRLSDSDLALLQETLAWFRKGSQPGLTVLGFYRSNTLPDFELSPEDREFLHSNFSAAEDLVMLVKPGLMGASDTDFWIRRYGKPAELSAGSTPPPLMSWPLPRPHLSTDESESKSGVRSRRWWIWFAVAIAFGLLAGALSGLRWRADGGVRPVAAAVAASPAVPPSPVQQPLTNPPPVDAPALSPQDTVEIHDLIGRWAAAVRRGDAEAAAQCYAPVVSPYFNRPSVTRDAVRQSIRRARALYPHLSRYELSGLDIAIASNREAEVTFHKQWRFAGRNKSGGEERERMTIVQRDGAWLISSEQAGSGRSVAPGGASTESPEKPSRSY